MTVCRRLKYVTAASVAAISREMSIKMLAETAGGHQAWVDFYLMATDGGVIQYARKLNVSQYLIRLAPPSQTSQFISDLPLDDELTRESDCICSTCTTPQPSAMRSSSSKPKQPSHMRFVLDLCEDHQVTLWC